MGKRKPVFCNVIHSGAEPCKQAPNSSPLRKAIEREVREQIAQRLEAEAGTEMSAACVRIYLRCARLARRGKLS